MAEVASAYVSLLPSARGFGSATSRQINPQMDKAGRSAGGRFSSGLKSAIAPAAALLGTAVLGGVIKSSIDLEARFGKTMALVAASTGAPKSAIADLRAEAMKLGASTKFSANESADAMLELGKAGISTSDILGGALKGTLLLAAAGDTDLATATTIASNAMNTFNLRGKDMNAVAAALAGGANASSASVSSLGEALGQVGPGATNAGLSLQETVGVLSAFDAAGVKGSDAGTSLKTMLTSLVPQTDKAAAAMRNLGLDFTDSQGNFVPITEVAGQLRSSLKGLSEEQRTTALTTIFGSDATRAATVLMNEGASGIGKYIKATKNQNAAQKLAKANMSGTAGAMERLSGAVETAQLALGTALAPAVTKVANFLSGSAIPAVTSFVQGMQSGAGAGGRVASVMKTLATNLDIIAPALGVVVTGLIAYSAAMKVAAIATAIQAAGTVGATGATWSLNAALRANPIGLVVTALVALGVGLVAAYQRFEGFRNVVDATFAAVKRAVAVAMPYVRSIIRGATDQIVGIVKVFKGIFTGDWKSIWEGVKQILRGALAVVKTLAKAQLNAIVGIIRNLGPLLLSAATSGFGKLKSGAVTGFKSAQTYVKSIPGKVVSALGDLSGLLVNAGQQIISGLIAGITSKIGALGKKLGEVTQYIKDKKGPESYDKVMLTPAGRMIMDGLIRGLQDGEKGLGKYLDTVTKKIAGSLELKRTRPGMSKKQRAAVADYNDAARKAIKSQKAAVDQLEKSLSRLTKRVDAAKSKLDSLKDARASLASQTASSISGELDLNQTSGRRVSFATVAANVSGLASRAKAFAGTLRALLKAGIPAGLVQEVAALGTVDGVRVADALLSGSKQQIGQLAKDYSGVSAYSKQIGDVVAGGMYDAGIRAQEGILKGLLDDKAIQRAADRLAKKLTKAVRKSLGIKSPSRVFQNEVGKYIPAGVVAGIDDGQRALDRRVAGMVSVAKIGTVQPGDFAGGVAASAPAPTMPEFNIYPQPGQSEEEIGRAAANRFMFAATR